MEIVVAVFMYIISLLYGLIEIVAAIFVRFLYMLWEFSISKTGKIVYNSIAAILLITIAVYTLM